MGLLLEHFEFMEQFTLDDSWVSYPVISRDDDSPNPLRHTGSPRKLGGHQKRFTWKVWLMLLHVASWLHVYNLLLSLSSSLSSPSRTWSSAPGSWEAIENKMSKCDIIDLSRSRGSSGPHPTRWQRITQMRELGSSTHFGPLGSPKISHSVQWDPELHSFGVKGRYLSSIFDGCSYILKSS